MSGVVLAGVVAALSPRFIVKNDGGIQGDPGDFGAVADAGPFEDVRDVKLDRALRQPGLVGDAAV